MKSFITFEEKSLSVISDSQLLELYISLGISGLETALHEKLLDTTTYKSIFKKIFKNNMTINFHTPDFIDPYNFDIMYFKDNSSFKKNTELYLDTILSILNYSEKQYNPIITFHGSSVEKNDFKTAEELTKRYCDFLLELIEKRRLPFILAIESLNSTKKPVFGGNRQEIMDLICEFDSSKLRICWDIIHDFLGSSEEYILPSEDFIKKVVNVHIHGYSDFDEIALEHTPLHKSTLPYESMVNTLVSSGYDGPLTNELLWFGSKDYLYDLKSDSIIINKIIEDSLK